ncbi:MAG: sulfurtransferase [Deltaproteobacteria bacterium]|nr:sulfurtransferase [Deltaproteobacteria bacterium]
MQHSPEFLALVQASKAHVREIDLAGLQALQASGAPFHLVDVREDREWQAGHIPGAQHLGRGVIERDAIGRFPDKGATLVLYCGGGFRSALAADALQKMGYTAVISLDGGWKAWTGAGLPVAHES